MASIEQQTCKIGNRTRRFWVLKGVDDRQMRNSDWSPSNGAWVTGSKQSAHCTAFTIAKLAGASDADAMKAANQVTA